MKKKKYETLKRTTTYVKSVMEIIYHTVPDGHTDRFIRDAIKEKCQRDGIEIPEYEE